MSADQHAEYAAGDMVEEPTSGLVGTVIDWWRDDHGQWLTIRWQKSVMRPDEVNRWKGDPDA